jgi:hypothetical protein
MVGYPRYAGEIPVLAGIKPCCASCKWFKRIPPESIGVSVKAVASPEDQDEDVDDSLLEGFGRCVRNPPQFFYETLNGEWPVVHETKYCGEYRVSDNNPYTY